MNILKLALVSNAKLPGQQAKKVFPEPPSFTSLRIRKVIKFFDYKPFTMHNLFLVGLVILLASTLTNAHNHTRGASNLGQKTRPVYINGEKISEETLVYLEQQYRIKILDGRYWYDRYTGVWGYEGGPAVGIGVPGLNLKSTKAERVSTFSVYFILKNPYLRI